MRIQHNIMAMNAYRNYTGNTSALSKNLEKLSSGYKINRAGDDAAGLAISEKMRAQITGLDVAQKNAKDGISLVQTAEGALTEVHDMLNRMVELADQSANGTYDNETDRLQLQKEVKQLRAEIDRIADSSNFNGIKLLDGSMEQTTAVDAATDVGVTVVADGKLSAPGQAGKYTIDLSQLTLTNSHTAAEDTTITIGGVALTVNVGAGKTMTADEIGAALVTAFNGTNKEIGANKDTFSMAYSGGKLTLTMDKVPTKDFAQDMSVTVQAGTNTTSSQGNQLAVTVDKAAVVDGGRLYAQASYTLTANDVVDGATLTIGDTTYTFAVGKDSKFAGMANVIDLTDKKIGDADLVKTAASRLSAAAKDNKNFIVGSDTTSGKLTFTEREGGVDYDKHNLVGTDGNKQDGDWKGLIMKGNANPVTSGMGLTLQIGDTADHFNQLTVSIRDMHADSLGISEIDIGSQSGAQAAVDVIRNAINQVSDVRGTLGATQNRLDHTINNLSVMEENIQDAESTIRDTDVADEMMAYTKNNILIQSAQAMLAQANQVPQGVLQLLQ